MARFSLVFAAAGVLLLVALATVAEATTITTIIVDDENISRKQSGGCSMQMQDPMMLNDCMMYLMSSTQGGGSRRAMMRESPQEYMRMCCMQLENMEQECMCESLEMMMMKQGGMQPQMMSRMMNMAKNLPMQCGLMNQPCQMQSGWF
ncbi:albumin-8-like [Rutidosis leptorrhynchoides]|uniref:albumin-8-like n=1 Tax=Rutidosis leptorrhynchoides TaxID=125765 RepID=UPI003A9A5927